MRNPIFSLIDLLNTKLHFRLSSAGLIYVHYGERVIQALLQKYKNTTLSDDDLQTSFQNPEPAKELVEQNLIDADNIGDTVFSKHWLFTTLMNLIKVCCAAFYGLAGSPGSNCFTNFFTYFLF